MSDKDRAFERDPIGLLREAIYEAFLNRQGSHLLVLTNDWLKWVDANQYFQRYQLVSHITGFDWKRLPPIGIAHQSMSNHDGVILPTSKVPHFADDHTLELHDRRIRYVDTSCVHGGFKPIFRLHYHGNDVWSPIEIISPTEEDAVLVAGLFDGTMP